MSQFKSARFRYTEFEPNNGTDGNLSPIIFLPNIIYLGNSWDDIPQIIANDTKRKTYTVDSKNFEDGEWGESFNLYISADDLIHFMDTHEIKKAILIGEDTGAVTAMTTALKWPDRVEKIVIEDMVVGKYPEEMLDFIFEFISELRNIIHAAEELDEVEGRKSILQYLLTRFSGEYRSKIRKKLDEIESGNLAPDLSAPKSLKKYLELVEKTFKEEEALRSDPQGFYRGPAYFIYGGNSYFSVDDDEEHIRKFFPMAILECIERSDHYIHIDWPVQFISALRKILTS